MRHPTHDQIDIAILFPSITHILLDFRHLRRKSPGYSSTILAKKVMDEIEATVIDEIVARLLLTLMREPGRRTVQESMTKAGSKQSDFTEQRLISGLRKLLDKSMYAAVSIFCI